MGKSEEPTWIILEYDSNEILDKSLIDRHQRILLYPAVSSMVVGSQVDVQITIGSSNVLFPMKADVLSVRERPEGPSAPRGVTLRIIEADAARFERMCAFVDGMWWPSARRSQPRYLASVKATYLLGDRKHQGATVDISRQGLYLRTDGPLADPGQEIVVRLNPSRFRSAIEINCQVRWVDSVDGRRGMGLLCKSPPEAIERLARLVDRIVQNTRA